MICGNCAYYAYVIACTALRLYEYKYHSRSVRICRIRRISAVCRNHRNTDTDFAACVVALGYCDRSAFARHNPPAGAYSVGPGSHARPVAIAFPSAGAGGGYKLFGG